MSRLVLIAMLLALAGGCASSPTAEPTTQMSATNQPHAECLVCKHNADLACVDVKVEKDTPTCVYNGTTYYFCSTACKKKFEKEPAKYINQK